MYTVLTILVMFYRPDFLNMTVCIVALYMLFNTERITKGKFKLLVLGILLSLLYDGVWFYIKHTEYADDRKNDATGETSLRKFSLMMSYTSFLLRVSNLI